MTAKVNKYKKSVSKKSSFNLKNQKAPKLTSPDCTFFSSLPSDVGGERQSLGSAEEDAGNVEGDAVKGGRGRVLGLPLGSTAGSDGSGTAGTTPGSQQQWGQGTTLTVCTKGLKGEDGKHSQYSSAGMMAEAPPPI